MWSDRWRGNVGWQPSTVAVVPTSVARAPARVRAVAARCGQHPTKSVELSRRRRLVAVRWWQRGPPVSELTLTRPTL